MTDVLDLGRRGGKIETMVLWPSAAILTEPDAWILCEHPERPIDDLAGYHTIKNGEPCRGCDLAREAAERRGEVLR